jgi:hypothetical protein
MKNEKVIDRLLAEIIAADVALKPREAELRAALVRLLESKPVVRRDDAFYAELRDRLIREFATAKSQVAETDGQSFRVLAWLRRPWITLPAVGIALLLVISLSSQQVGTRGSAGKVALGESGTSGLRVSKIAGDFGPLVTATGSDSVVSARPQSGGGGGLAMGLGMGGDAAKMAAGVAVAVPAPTAVSGVSEAVGIIAPDFVPTYFRYVYEGELDLAESVLPVLRRVKGQGAPDLRDQLAGLIPDIFNFDLISGLKLQSFSAFQDETYGLSVNADMIEETVSISQYYPRWPHPEQSCRDQECYESLRLRESDMLSDDEVIALSDAFLDELGIDRSAYGEPVVRSDWRRWLAAATVRADFWFPDSVNVTYPLVTDGGLVVDESGYGTGLGVNVNVRERRADSVWGLQTLNYDSADYEAVTDTADVLAVVNRGGVWGYVPEDGVSNVVDIMVGEPERVLIRTWQYPGDGTSKELLAPGLRFPVMDPERDTRGTPEYITVPLIKEFHSRPDYGGPIMYLKGSDGTASSGGVTEPAVDPVVVPEAR